MGTDQIQVERRVGQRFEYHLPVVIRVVGQGLDIAGCTENLSARGAYLYVESPLTEGAPIELTLTMSMRRAKPLHTIEILYGIAGVRVRRLGGGTSLLSRRRPCQDQGENTTRQHRDGGAGSHPAVRTALPRETQLEGYFL